ncbi:MAG: hypothetical protein ACR2QF_03015 [Geminicoccaceae bacterium]
MVAKALERTQQSRLRNMTIQTQDASFWTYTNLGFTVAELSEPGRFDKLAIPAAGATSNMVGSWLFVTAKDGPAIFNVTEIDVDGHLHVAAFQALPPPPRVPDVEFPVKRPPGRPPKAQAA